MPGFYHYTKNRRQPRRKMHHPLSSVIWIVGLAILFYTHAWWPGIMILIGINMVIGTLANAGWGQAYLADRDERWDDPAQEASPAWAWDSNPPPAPARPAPAQAAPVQAVPVQAAPAQSAPMQAEPQRYTGWLPERCPNCGAPVRPRDVKWVGSQASCEYCASALPLKHE